MTRALLLVPDARSIARAAAMGEMLAAGGWQVELAAPSEEQPPVANGVTCVPLYVTPPPTTSALKKNASLAPWDAVPWQRFAPHHDRLFALARSRPADVIVAFGIGALGAAVDATSESRKRLVIDVDRVAAADTTLVPAHIWPFVHDVERWLVPYADAVTAASDALADLAALRTVIARPTVIETRVAEEPGGLEAEATSRISGTRVSVLAPPGTAARFLESVNLRDLPSRSSADGTDVALVLPAEDSDYWIPSSQVVRALAAGVPVVAPDTAGAAGLVGRFGAGVLANPDPGSLAAALERLVSEVSTLEQARSGARAAGEWLARERQRQALLSTFADALAHQPRLADPEALAAGRRRGQELVQNHPHIFGVRPDLAQYSSRRLGRELWRRLSGAG